MHPRVCCWSTVFMNIHAQSRVSLTYLVHEQKGACVAVIRCSLTYSRMQVGCWRILFMNIHACVSKAQCSWTYRHSATQAHCHPLDALHATLCVPLYCVDVYVNCDVVIIHTSTTSLPLFPPPPVHYRYSHRSYQPSIITLLLTTIA